MPVQRAEAPVPLLPFLGIYTSRGTVSVFQVGSMWLHAEDPNDVSKYTPMILTTVTRRKLVFKCGCNQAGCTRKFEYKLFMHGKHIDSGEK